MRCRPESEYDEYAIDMVLAVLADPNRRAILNQLDTKRANSVANMRKTIHVTRQGMHKHLKLMIMAGIVIKSRRSPAALYYMDPRPIRRSLKILARRYKRDLRPLRNLYTFGSPHSPFDRWR